MQKAKIKMPKYREKVKKFCILIFNFV